MSATAKIVLPKRRATRRAPRTGDYNTYRMGWYVDDIRLVSGSFDEIGRATEKRFLVQNGHKGEWTHRVRAVFGENVKTAPSNVEIVRVSGYQGRCISGGRAPSRASSDPGRAFRRARSYRRQEGTR